MKYLLSCLAMGASLLATPVLAQDSSYPRDDPYGGADRDIGRQIYYLQTHIDALDRSNEISAGEASALIRDLRSVETRLATIRDRSAPSTDAWRGDVRPQNYWSNAPRRSWRGSESYNQGYGSGNGQSYGQSTGQTYGQSNGQGYNQGYYARPAENDYASPDRDGDDRSE